MKTKRFDFNFKPLQLNVCISVDGSVPDKQNYNGDADEYTPDYTVTPLIIQPQVSRMDKDEIVAPGNINSLLANVRWYEIVAGVSTLILAENTNYEVSTSGGQAGRIKVKKNVAVRQPLTLEFYAEYLDTRTNQVYVIRASHIVSCGNSTPYIPDLVLDAADQTVYNPLVDRDSQTVTASLRLGASECPVSKRQFVWEVLRANGSFTAVGQDDFDFELSVSGGGTTVTVNRTLMGDNLVLRCRAKYDPDGNPAGVTLNDAAPSAVVAFVRRIPKYEFDITGLPTNIPAGILAVCPEVYVWDVNGPVENPENVLLALWYIATNRASGSLSYSQVGHGFAPTIPTTAMSELYGGVIGVDVIDPGPLAPWEDGDGSVFVDGESNVILIK